MTVKFVGGKCETRPVYVRISAELSSTGTTKWAMKDIDICIVDLVEALVQAGIYTDGCCCGHGDCPGSVVLSDGRVLEIRLIEHAQIKGKLNE